MTTTRWETANTGDPWEEFARDLARATEGAILEKIEARQRSQWQRGAAW